MPEDYDEETKELLRGARDSMLAAASIYRSLDIAFRVEIFVVVSVIGWRYLFHAYYQANHIGYHLKHDKGKYWGLSDCLKSDKPHIKRKTKNILRDLIKTRNEIEHWKTDKIDESLLPKLKYCFDEFDYYIVKLFGSEYKLGVSIDTIPASPSTTQQGDSWHESNPHADKKTNKFIMDFANSSQEDTLVTPASTIRIMVPYPDNRRKNYSKRNPCKKSRAGRRKLAD